jgi:hypothetical protein
MILFIGDDLYINTDRVRYYDTTATPYVSNGDNVEIVFFKSDQGGSDDDDTLTVTDDAAKHLRRWLEKHAESIFPKP